MAIRPWLWLAVPGLGTLELVLHVFFAARAPGFQDYVALVPDIDRMRRAGDVLVIAPEWAEPLARQAFGEERMPLTDLARIDMVGFPAALEVSIRGQRAPELSEFKQVDAHQSGFFWLRRLENPHFVASLYVFADHVLPGDLSVGEWNGEAERDCAFRERPEPLATATDSLVPPRARFACSGAKASYIGVTLLPGRDGRPRRCILAPAPWNGVLRLRFARVPVGKSLRVHAARRERAASARDQAHVAFSVYLAGQRIAREAIPAQTQFKGYAFPVPARSEPSEVVFEIEGERGAGREFCFSAEMQ